MWRGIRSCRVRPTGGERKPEDRRATMPFVLLNLAAAFCLGYASMQLQQLEKSIVAAPGSATPNGEPSGRAAQLRMLEELHASGVLTNEEFERKKQALG